MGQKINPIGLRVGVKYKGAVIRDWDAKWYADKKDYADILLEDIRIRTYLEKKLKNASFERIQIERKKDLLSVAVTVARPNVVFGKDNATLKEITAQLKKLASVKQVKLNIVRIKNPNASAKLIAENIARQIENRVAFRNAQKMAIQKAQQAGVLGIKTQVKGRLNGADMARHEGYSEGRIPMSTLRANLDYWHEPSHTQYGVIGVKVWVYHGEVLPKKGGK